MECLSTLTTTATDSTAHTFDAVDRFGRAVGCIVYTSESTFTAQPNEHAGGYRIKPGHYFTFTPQATRGGKKYGALQRFQIFDTEQDRAAAIAKYLAAAAKRAVKLNGK